MSGSNLNYTSFPSNPTAFSKRLEEYKNGRVILYAGDNFKPYETYQGSLEPQKCFTDSVSHIHTPTSLTQSYFSRENVDLVQNEIIKRIYNQTGYVISRQSDTNLQVIMRSIYLQYGKNLPCQIKEQVLELNEEVYKECLRIMIPNIQQTIGYRRDLNKLPVTMNRAINVSSKGTKTLYDKVGF
jgi:hypothetical protein